MLAVCSLNVYAPVLGNPNSSVMRELHDYARVFALMHRHEDEMGGPAGGRGGRRYDRVVFSRLEFAWLAAHPPLSALAADTLWVPSGQLVTGTNDRHAVMGRAMARAYFGRWHVLMGTEALRQFSVHGLQRMGPEDLLDGVLEHAHIPWGEFPNMAYLACCESATTRRVQRTSPSPASLRPARTGYRVPSPSFPLPPSPFPLPFPAPFPSLPVFFP